MPEPLPLAALTALGLSEQPVLAVKTVVPLDLPDGQRVWIKRAEKTSTFGATLRRIIARLMPVAVLRPAPVNGLIEQAREARRLTKAGIPTPSVLYSDNALLILSDGGENISKVVHRLSRHPEETDMCGIDRDALAIILLKMTDTFAQLHQSALAHGRPKIRDVGWRRAGEAPTDGTALLLDLEERPWDVMPMPAAQARDIFLWLADLGSHAASRPSVVPALGRFTPGMSTDTRAALFRLRRMLGLIAPLTRLIAKTPLANREIVGALAAYDAMKSHL